MSTDLSSNSNQMIHHIKTALLAISIFGISASSAYANPDVWIKAGITYRFEDNKVSAVSYMWRFDEYFSSRSVRTYDVDESGVLEPEEAERLRIEAFDPLAKFDYYVHVWVAGEKRENLTIESFNASIEGTQLVYRFTVPLTPSADPSFGAVITSLYDGRTVVDFRFFKDDFLLVEGAVDPSCKFRIARGRGAQSDHPQPVTLQCGV